MGEPNYSEFQNPEPAYGDNNNDASPYSKKTPNSPAPVPPPSKAAGKTPVNGEVTILGYYTWITEINGKKEIKYLLEHKWYPGYEDFKEIAGPTAIAPKDFSAVLGMINEYAPKSIKRLNFLTHADSDTIGITGYMDGTDVIFTAKVGEVEIANASVNDTIYTFLNKTFELADVRKRFTDDAIFVLYGCKAGFDRTTLLSALRELLQVTVIGFKEKIVFCPLWQSVEATTFNRKGEKMGIYKSGFDCAVNATSDWRSLINDGNAVKIPK